MFQLAPATVPLPAPAPQPPRPAPPAPPRGLLEEIAADARLVVEFRCRGRAPRPLDWARVALGSRGFQVLAVARADRACAAWVPSGPGGRLVRRAARFALNVSNRLANVVAKTEITCGSFDGGLFLSDRGHVIVGVRSIGSGTFIHDHVTIGRGTQPGDKPEIGRRVWIGPHCVLYGSIRVGDGATVLPHTVLNHSVPAGAVVQGNPARVVRTGFDNSALRATAAPGVALELLGAAGER